MYYEEKMVGCAMMCRHSAKADWEHCSSETMGRKILELENAVMGLQAHLRMNQKALRGFRHLVDCGDTGE